MSFNWKTYLQEERGLTPQIIDEAGLYVDDRNRLVIPVRNIGGEFLFNKYRNPPGSKIKYTYDKGAKAALYGAEILPDTPWDALCIYITEGEIDALTMRQIGLPAVSSTGGAGTWKDEWNILFGNRNVAVCFDADKTGVHNMLNMVYEYGWSFLLLDPAHGKDINEQYTNLSKEDKKTIKKKIEEYRQDEPIKGATKKETLQNIKKWHETASNVKKEIMSSPSPEKGIVPILHYILEWLANKKKELNRKPVKKKAPPTNGTDVERAKAYPIENLIDFGNDNFTHCIFHKERTPSMKLNKDNTVHCFGGCGKHADAIDVYQHIHNVSFKEAVSSLTKDL